jgi:hypothetical protein
LVKFAIISPSLVDPSSSILLFLRLRLIDFER